VEVFADAVENDDGVIDRIPGDGEERADLEEIDVPPGEDEGAEADQQIVEQPDQRAEGKGELEAHGEVNQDAENPHQQGQEGGPEQLGADLGADDLDVAPRVAEVFAGGFFNGVQHRGALAFGGADFQEVAALQRGFCLHERAGIDGEGG